MRRGRLQARVERKKGAFIKSFMATEEPIARAATAAIGEAGDDVKAKARADIATAGFSRRWQNALRVDLYPKGRTSIDAAAHVYHKIPYARVFEEGATIEGSPFLWLPLPQAPDKIGRFRMTPRRYPGPLQFVRRPGQPPLLVASLGLSRARAKKAQSGTLEVSLAAAKKGASGGGKRRVIRSVPIFIGIRTVEIDQRFSIGRIVRRAAGRLGALYFRHLKAN